MEDQIEKHPNLLDPRLLEIYTDIKDNIITYHRLDFRLFETLRTLERQKYLLEKKYTKTLNSRHLPNKFGKSEAMDLVLYIDNKPTWDLKYKYYYDFLGHKVLEKYDRELIWGGNFKSFYDGVHFQLKRVI